MIILFENIPDIMTFKECQNLLKIGKNSLLDILHNDEIYGAFKIGSRWKILKDGVIDFIKYRA